MDGPLGIWHTCPSIGVQHSFQCPVNQIGCDKNRSPKQQCSGQWNHSKLRA